MFERTAKKLPSFITSQGSKLEVTMGVDLNRDPVYLSGEVIPATAFARAMLILGKVVQTKQPAPKDHTDYQRWVERQYLKLLESKESDLIKITAEYQNGIAELLKNKSILELKLAPLTKIISKKKLDYFNWLYENDRQAWVVLDPIVSVQKDGTFFEAFSGDESIYAKVFLPSQSVKSKDKPNLGTTNIDFSVMLEREFDRVRSYRGINLNVGLSKVEFKTSAATVEEEKIPLPESWVRGLVEVQSALSLSQINFDLSSQALSEIIARIEAETERNGPRSLRFNLIPDSPIQIELEPWGYIFNDDWFNYQGKTTEVVRIWGRRRLGVLKQVLPDTDKISVKFLGSGMPSFWTVVKDGVELTIGLSGWTANDWASKAKFSSFIPTTNVVAKLLPSALNLIQKEGKLTTDYLAQELNIKNNAATALLQRLCQQGKVMFDPERQVYRWRDLFPTLDLYQINDSSRELNKGVKLSKSADSTLESNEVISEVRFLTGRTKNEQQIYFSKVELDLDGRPNFAQCTCPFYNFNKLRQGPCRHMIALILKTGDL